MIFCLADVGLHPNVLSWLSTYLRGRTCSVTFQGCTASPRIIHCGVPQGAVLSPDLYNFYVADHPSPLELLEAYADDNHGAESAKHVDEGAARLSAGLSEFSQWVDSKNLSIAPDKSTVTLFSLDPA